MRVTVSTRVFAVFALLLGLAFAISTHLYFNEHQFDTQLETLADDRLRVGSDAAGISQQTGQILKLAEAFDQASPEEKSGIAELFRSSLSENEEAIRMFSAAHNAALPAAIAKRRDNILQALGQQNSTVDFRIRAIDYANAVQQFSTAVVGQLNNRYQTLIQSEVRARDKAIALVLAGVALAGLAMLYLYRSVIYRLLRLQSCMSAIIEGREVAIPTAGGDEIASMGRALEYLVTTLKRREARLEDQLIFQ